MKNVTAFRIQIFVTAFALALYVNSGAQTIYTGNNFVTIPSGSTPGQITELAASVTPSRRQLNWQEMEMTAFIHFTVNTYYNQEWGQGTEDPAVFNPVQFDANQWVSTCREAGLKCIIMTAKHHDGFCLWPSRFTSHSIAASPWRDGKGDLVKEVADECRKQGMKFGIYLSPWDRHEKSYGTEAYNEHFRNQLTELLTNYGRIDEVWFDGACGEGPNGKRQVYNWESYYSLIRKLQPDAVIAIMGPDVRWVGTESGYGRETEWSVVPVEAADQAAIAAGSQQAAENEGFIPPGDMTDFDLGSRDKIAKAKTLIWYPSEVDVSIRPGWFWHESENDRVKTPEKLLDIYFSSVGRNSLLLLNIPPDTRGLIHENDIKSLRTWRKALDDIFDKNLAAGSKIKVLDGGNQALTNKMFDNINATHWTTSNKTTATLEFSLPGKQLFDVLLLSENISIGQRIEKFRLSAHTGGKWVTVTEGTTVGYKRLLHFPAVNTDKVRLEIISSRLNPAIAEFGLYKLIPEVKATPSAAAFTDSVTLTLASDQENVSIYYTLDGSEPGKTSSLYEHPITLSESATVRFIGYSPDGKQSFERKAYYFKTKYAVTFANAPDSRYDGGGPLGLVDGIRGSLDHTDGHWSGFNGTDMEVTIDLNKVLPIYAISAGFLQSTRSWIFPPSEIVFEISADGETYNTVNSIIPELPSGDVESVIK
ncbi:MAG TPA: alpha-L-fucosidase, partial [Bacteroidales bacterium]|nr:alpha-L-fucosidase [Bacteroidales bacterium]